MGARDFQAFAASMRSTRRNRVAFGERRARERRDGVAQADPRVFGRRALEQRPFFDIVSMAAMS